MISRIVLDIPDTIPLIIPDSRFEMPSLFHPGRKPVGNVKIDWTNPMSKGLVLCVINNLDLVNNFPVKHKGSRIEKLDIVNDSISDYTVLEEGIDSVTPISEVSICLGYRGIDHNINQSVAFGIPDDPEKTRCQAHLPWNDGVLYWDFGPYPGYGRATKSGLSYSDDDWVFTSSVINNDMKIFQNGIDVNASISASPNARVRSTAEKITLNKGNVGGLVSKYRYFYVYNYPFTIDLSRSIYRNPYQFLIPA